MPQRMWVIDSHTEGEPTRVIVEGGPDLGDGSVEVRRDRFREQFDHFRSAAVLEPRGSDAVVGAWLGPPSKPSSTASVIFFNNVGYLNMCVHGTIGVVATLAYLNRISAGRIALDTPVGTVHATWHGEGRVTVANVPSYRFKKNVPVDVPGLGVIHGDVAWGGNWFYLVDWPDEDYSLANIERLTDIAWRIRRQLKRAGVTGAHGEEIDHIELFGPPKSAENHSRNFVLCPGKAYDRSPCGTGTSAKLACLAADHKLEEDQPWRQESILGSLFVGTYRREGETIRPEITGSAFITADARLVMEEDDPFRFGIKA